MSNPSPTIHGLFSSPTYSFSKTAQPHVRLLAGLGVEGDVHSGTTVKHRSRVARDPSQPNLRQVHLIHLELYQELQSKGFKAQPGNLGENVCTVGIDLLALPKGTRLHLGREAVIEVTGLRNPCAQIDQFENGLLAAVLERSDSGALVRKSGIMAIVLQSGVVHKDDPIAVVWPAQPHQALEVV